MPVILLPLLHHAGAVALFAVIIVALIIVALHIGLLDPRTTGHGLETVNASPAGLVQKDRAVSSQVTTGWDAQRGE